MTYRNDHEAALARVDALEGELTKLRKHVAQPHVGALPPPSKPFVLVTSCIVALAAGIAGGVALGVADDAGAPHEARAGSTTHREVLAACAAAIERAPPLDATRTDPRRAKSATIEPIARTAAPCRDTLHLVLERDALSAEERDALWKWAASEDELSGAISRIQVYYRSDPYKLDAYATARQLWHEYDRAHEARNRAVDAWRVTVASS